MILDSLIVIVTTIVVTIGIVLGIIYGKYTLVKRYDLQPTISSNISDNSEEVNDFIIRETKERINQELQNMSADELKSNVVAATSVVFAILLISEFLRIYSTIDVEILWLPLILVSVTIVILFISFLNGIKVLFPRSDRFNLWLPRSTNESYAERKIQNQREIQKEFKEELIHNFESIELARKIDGYFLTWGYALLIGGSLISFITLLLTHIFWLHG
jgi:hypothetical protein